MMPQVKIGVKKKKNNYNKVIENGATSKKRSVKRRK